MRRRFFLIILGFLIVTSVSMLALHFFILRTEQMHLIDRQIESNASVLLSADIDFEELERFERGEEILEDVFHGEKFNQFIIIRDSTGRIIYKSRNAERLPDDLDYHKDWQTIDTDEYKARILSLYLRPQNIVLQIGLLLDRELWQWQVTGRRIILFTSVIVLLLAVFSASLSRKLLTPLAALAQYISYLATSPNARLPKSLEKISLNSRDELALVVKSLSDFRTQVQALTSTSDSFTAQLAHEIKTPLTVMRIKLEKLRKDGVVQPLLTELEDELQSLNEKISMFLDWTSTKNALNEPIFSLSAEKELTNVVARLEMIFPQRIEILETHSLKIFAGKLSLDVVFSNLLQNALNYSEGKVEVSIRGPSVIIRDYGKGLPEDVRRNFGKPFNKGANGRTGLGLALVHQICLKYDWKLEYESGDQGTQFTLTFPES